MKKNSRRDGGSMMIKYYTEIKNDGMDKKIWFRIWIFNSKYNHNIFKEK